MAPETRQQIIALVLGIVFIVGFILFAQRLGQFLRDRQQQNKVASEKISPTPTPKVVTFTVSPTPMIYKANSTQPKSIPSTGPETPLLLSLFGLLAGGILLRKKSI